MASERVSVPDGGAFDCYKALPETGRGPGILLLQEIFGVNGYIREVADRLAAMGYVVMAPDVFWRLEPGVALAQDQSGLETAQGYMARYREEWAQGLDDLDAAYAHLEGMAEVSGGVGVMGFCLGGRLTWHLAARHQPQAAVAYYPSGVASALDEAERIRCPLLIHIGAADAYLPPEDVAALRDAVSGRANVDLRIHPGAGHAFDNHTAAMFYDAEAASVAWGQTVTFLGRHLPV